ncbi:MAG: sigma 54-interacting transcriptional regulator [Gemmatimonadaceae bacterium]
MTHRFSIRLQRDEPVILPLVGSSRPMLDLARQVNELAQDCQATTVLLVGESGTGKGRLAEFIHARSSRAASVFAEVNCAMLKDPELEIELFGDPTAPDARSGVVDAAVGGTVFIDEVAELSPELQQRLYHWLALSRGRRQDDGTAGAADPAAVRVVAATGRDLVSEVNAGRFREDLYYMLSAAPVYLPPLRARSRDDLADVITATFTMLTMNMSDAPCSLSDEVIECFISYPWPGNIRELRNALERALLVGRGAVVLQRIHLPAELRDAQGSDAVYTPRTLMDVERAHIHRTLHAHKLNRTHAARELGISRATLIKKIKEYGLVYRGADNA